MRKLLQAAGLFMLLLVMNAATFLVMFGPPQTRAQENGASQVEIVAGDLNCDGYVDIGDAVGLLEYLFRDGDPPTVCAQTTESPPALTKEDLVEALVEARNLFEPTVQQREHLIIEVGPSEGPTDYDTLIEPEEGEMFVVTAFIYSGSFIIRVNDNDETTTVTSLFEPNQYGGTVSRVPVPHEDFYLVLKPGMKLEARNTTIANYKVQVWGYWAPHEEE